MDLLDLSVDELLLLKKLKAKNPTVVKALIDDSNPKNLQNKIAQLNSQPQPLLQSSNWSYDEPRNLYEDPYYQKLAVKLRNTRAIAVDGKIVYETCDASQPFDPYQGVNLYVANLTETTTEQDLENMFSPFGRISACTVLVDPQTGKSKNVGFVKFEHKPSADKAITQLNGTIPNGFSTPIQVKLAINRKRSADVMKNLDFKAEDGHVVFIYNLHFDTSDRSVWKLFGPFGAIINVSVIRKPDTKQCVGYAFVQMPHYEEAKSAIESLDGIILNKRRIEVSFKKSKNKVSRMES